MPPTCFAVSCIQLSFVVDFLNRLTIIVPIGESKLLQTELFNAMPQPRGVNRYASVTLPADVCGTGSCENFTLVRHRIANTEAVNWKYRLSQLLHKIERTPATNPPFLMSASSSRLTTILSRATRS